MRTLKTRVRVLLMTSAFGGMFVLNGCDPQVRDAVLGGVGGAASGLSNAFIEAFITSLQNQDDETATTVQVFEGIETNDAIFA